ncbi:IscS subfamily cysteine desulfurase [Anoxybacillus gonensis]|uniref:IscS subfamily cysteine desulfurase n=1 Tax=Anoxybacillus gonensis TaxID=198467 RepID=UPI0002C003EE|nr:IscS subfamily cysteine desulfurase [Anoxybacillus gonensis]EMI10567.1 cysteine desulfurase [Anoxybacillus gonensis]
MIYLDYAATTPMSEEALAVYVQSARTYFGNASSLHDVGTAANELLTICRKQLTQLIRGEEKGIYFTSGGTEANVLAIRSLAYAHRHKGKHIITSSVEHASVHAVCAQLEQEGFTVTYVPVDRFGQVDIGALERALTDETILVSIQHANSEIGTIQPLQQIGELLKEKQIIFHSDCVQTFGKIPIDVKQLHLDSISIASHKIYGPKGVGAVYINPRVRWHMWLPNTTHEGGFRPGTVNVPGIASFTTAAIEAEKKRETVQQHMNELRRYFVEQIAKKQLSITVFEHPTDQLPHIVGCLVHGFEGQYVMLHCNRHGIAISTGSACQVGKQAPSKTMIAIGKEEDEAKQFIRLSFGMHTTKSEVEEVVSVLEQLQKERMSR